MNALQWITRFARDHRDPRNITLHCWGVPMVFGGLAVLIAEPAKALTWAAALLLSGSLLQALGHVYEGRRPRHGWRMSLMAPMFVGLQALHWLGLAMDSWQQVEQGAGPRRMRDLAHPA